MCNMCTRDVSAPEPPVVKTIDEEKTNRALEKFKEKHNIITNPDNEEIQKEVAYQPDLLAVSTQFTKVVVDYLNQQWKEMQQTQAYTILTRFSQPFHITVGILVLVYWLNTPGTATNIRLWKALYVAAVATHLGSQIWMTLISGVVLYFNLPRHEFGRVQTVLFPVYYLFNAIVSLLALVAYFRTQCLLKFEHISWIQFLLLLAVFSIEAGVRLSLVKPMLRAKHIKTQMEEAAGGGQEVGKLVLGELAHCPRYMRVLRTFRAYHSSIATGTMIALGCSIYSTMIIVDSMCY